MRTGPVRVGRGTKKSKDRSKSPHLEERKAKEENDKIVTKNLN